MCTKTSLSLYYTLCFCIKQCNFHLLIYSQPHVVGHFANWWHLSYFVSVSCYCALVYECIFRVVPTPQAWLPKVFMHPICRNWVSLIKVSGECLQSAVQANWNFPRSRRDTLTNSFLCDVCNKVQSVGWIKKHWLQEIPLVTNKVFWRPSILLRFRTWNHTLLCKCSTSKFHVNNSSVLEYVRL